MKNTKIWLKLAMVMSFGIMVSSCNNKTSKAVDDTPKRMEILFLGHKNNANHNSLKLAEILSREYFRSGINISFTDNPDDLNKRSGEHTSELQSRENLV